MVAQAFNPGILVAEKQAGGSGAQGKLNTARPLLKKAGSEAEGVDQTKARLYPSIKDFIVKKRPFESLGFPSGFLLRHA